MPPLSEKVCMVCGDKALGYNFNAVTCESCKAFFRRNALSTKEFTCPFNSNCDISVVTRRFCQKCRLEKCFTVGMRKDYIMTEEDKVLKRIKMETNRTKRRALIGQTNVKVKRDPDILDDGGQQPMEIGDEGSSIDFNTTTIGSTSPSIVPPELPISILPLTDEATQASTVTATTAATSALEPIDTSAPSSGIGCLYSPSYDPDPDGLYCDISSSRSPDGITNTPPFPNITSPTSDIVDRLVDYPEDATRLINHLMKTPDDALAILSKVLNSQKDAMRFIGHLIGSPGDALKIISKIMNSPFDALTVFTKFMSSPTDSLEIIAKIASNPGEVVQFIQQLMNSPEDAIEIMNKFMNSPAEALKMLNKMVSIPAADSTTPQLKEDRFLELSDRITKDNPMIKSMLDMNFGDNGPGSPPIGPMSLNPSSSSSSMCEKPLSCANGGSGTGSSAAADNSASIFAACSSDSVHNILQDIDNNPIQPNSLEDVICEAIKLEYEPTAFFSPMPSGSKELNDAERAKLNELIVANKALYAPLDEDLSGLSECIIKSNQGSSQDPQLLKIINLTAIAIRRLIKMSKKINAFKNMCQEDQVALLKGGCTEMMILRSVIQYDVDHCTWKIPHRQEAMSSISADVLKLAKGNVYEEHESFIRTFDIKWRKDENIILIMCAIVLFTPSRPKTVHADVLKLEQNSYFYLLRRYLESVYPGCEAKSTFLKLIKKISELQRLSDVIIGVYLDVNPTQVEPLLREIFDLKNY